MDEKSSDDPDNITGAPNTNAALSSSRVAITDKGASQPEGNTPGFSSSVLSESEHHYQNKNSPSVDVKENVDNDSNSDRNCKLEDNNCKLEESYEIIQKEDCSDSSDKTAEKHVEDKRQIKSAELTSPSTVDKTRRNNSSGDGLTNPTDHSGDGSTNPTDHSGEGSTNPTDHSGEGSTNPTDHSGDGSTNLTDHSGDDKTNPTDHSGDDSTNPTDHSGDDKTNPTDHSGDDSTNLTDHSGEGSTNPTDSSGDDSTNPTDHSGDGSTNLTDHSGDDKTNLTDHSGDDSTNLTDHSGDGSTNPTDHSGDGSTNLTDHSGEGSTNLTDSSGDDSTNPTDHSGDDKTNPTDHSGDGSTNPTDSSGDDKTNPTDHSGDDKTNPTDHSGDDKTNPTDHSGDGSTNLTDHSGDDSTNPTDSSGDDKTNPTDHSGDDKTNPTDHSGDDSTNPTDSSGDDKTNPTDHSGDDKTNPTDHSGDDKTNPTDHSGDDSTNLTDHSGEGSTNPTDSSGDDKTNPTDSSGDDKTNPTDHSGDDKTNQAGSSADDKTRQTHSSGDDSTNPTDHSGDDKTNQAGISANDLTNQTNFSVDDSTNLTDPTGIGLTNSMQLAATTTIGISMTTTHSKLCNDASTIDTSTDLATVTTTNSRTTEPHFPGNDNFDDDKNQSQDLNDDREGQKSLESHSVFPSEENADNYKKRKQLTNDDREEIKTVKMQAGSPVEDYNPDVPKSSLAEGTNQVSTSFDKHAAIAKEKQKVENIASDELDLNNPHAAPVKLDHETFSPESKTQEENVYKDFNQDGQHSSKDKACVKKEQFELIKLPDSVYVVQCGSLVNTFYASSTDVNISNGFLKDGKDVYRLLIEDKEIHIVSLSEVKNVSQKQILAESTDNLKKINYTESCDVSDRPEKSESYDKESADVDDVIKGMKKMSINEEGASKLEQGASKLDQQPKQSKVFPISTKGDKTNRAFVIHTPHLKAHGKYRSFDFGIRNVSTLLRFDLIKRNTDIRQELAKKCIGFHISLTNNLLVIGITTENEIMPLESATEYANDVVDKIHKVTQAYVCKKRQIESANPKKVLSAIQEHRLAKDGQLFAAYEQNNSVLGVLYHRTLHDKMDKIISSIIEQNLKKTGVKTISFKMDYVLRHMLDGEVFMDELHREFSTVEICHKLLCDDNSVLVTLRGKPTDDFEVMKEWINQKSEEYCVRSSFAYSDGCGTCEEIEAYLETSFDKSEVKYDVNEKANTVWFYSCALGQNEFDKQTSEAKKSILNKQYKIQVTEAKDESSTSVNKQLDNIPVSQEKAEKQHPETQTTAHASSTIKTEETYIENKAGEKQTEAQSNTKFEGQSDGKPVPVPRRTKNVTLGTSKSEPPAQTMDRGTDCKNDKGPPKDLVWNKEKLLENKEHGIIKVMNVGKNNRIEDVLKKYKLNADNTKVAYIEGQTEGLLIFQNYEDAHKFCEKAKGDRFCLLERMTLHNFSQPLNCEKWKSLGSDNKAGLIKELKAVGVTVVDKTDKKKINAPTTYQLKLAKQIIGQFCNEIATECIIKDVPSLVWRTVCVIHRNLIGELRKKCNSDLFSEEESEVHFPWSLEDEVNKLKETINYLKDCQIEDIAVDFKELSRVKEACEYVETQNPNVGGCIFDESKRTLFIYGESFDVFTKLKHQWEIRIGRKKQTPRGPRGTAQVVSQETTKVGKSADTALALKPVPVQRKTFETDIGLKVIIYEGSILKLDVDCIVNAANSNLNHGGGVALVIADAAGMALKRDGKEYIKQFGELSDGSVCTTTAGDLPYKHVIHAVGPRYSDYKRKHDGDRKCEKALLNAVKNAFIEADKLKMKSIALPAISSAIFGVPLDICARQYVFAVEEYCEHRMSSYHSTLSEIHFIDIKSNVVRAIQDAFSTYFKPGTRSKTDLPLAVAEESQYHEKKPPEPLMYEKGLNAHVFLFSGHDENDGLLLCKENIENVTDTKAVVVPVNERGKGGLIDDIIQQKTEYKEEFAREKQASFKGKVIGDVIKVPGYGCGFTFVMYVVYPRGEKSKSRNDRKNSLGSAIESILRTADESSKVHSIAVPMFGIDSKNADDVKLFSSVFVEQYKTFCDKKFKQNNKNNLTVKVICPTDEMYYSARKTFVDYVKQFKDEYTKEIVSDGDGNNDEHSKGAEGFSNDSSLGTCVICMDTITEPKTIQCGHTFCTDCIDQQFQYKKQCPTCFQVCGTITGDQPSGTIDVYTDKYRHLTGYESYDTIMITYKFPSGYQKDNHPSPGQPYKGIIRKAYLPANEEGRKIAKMLELAFKRKLTFTIGNSRTTGQQGVITWNDIHHKTDSRPHSQFGYPDPTYLDRVKDELAAKGITEADIENY